MHNLTSNRPVSFTPSAQIDIDYRAEQEALWWYMNPAPRPCFNPGLLDSIHLLQDSIEDAACKASPYHDGPISALVMASKIPGVFSLGGDLDLFRRLIRKQDRARLQAYARTCVDVLYRNINPPCSALTVALVQGSALGGGFEAALSCSVLVAERSAELGLPEILFNLFPGMGAYSLLSRRIGPRLAERLITSGKLYRASELYEMGVVDVLAEDGEGEQAVADYLRHYQRHRNGLQAIERVRRFHDPLDYAELAGIADIWVDAACRLRPRDLRKMQRLVNAQNHLQARPAAA